MLSNVARIITKPKIKFNIFQCCFKREASNIKRFYKNVSICQTDSSFEIILDNKKLKTPLGTLFRVPNHPLACLVAQEWDSQTEQVTRQSMHITSLCNTAIDNPTHRTRSVVINGILEFLATDTIFYRLSDPPSLVSLQQAEWDPVMDWARSRYDIHIEPTTGIGVPTVPDQTRQVLLQHLQSYNDWSLVGYQHLVETLKSLLLGMAAVDRFVQVDKAVALARLEESFQAAKWGNVEWYHDVTVAELRARVAAATLFVQLNSELTSVKEKKHVNSGIV